MDNKTVLLDFMKAADKGDFQTMSKLFGSRHKMYSPFSPQAVGRDEHVAMAKSFNDAFANVRHEILDVFETGNKVAIRGIWHGTQTGTFNNIPSTGKTVHWPFMIMAEVDKGEIINQWMECDSMSLMVQLGAMPAQTPETA